MSNNYLFIEDISDVLRRLGGNELLLRKLLTKFRDSYADCRMRLNGFLEISDLEEAYRLVHSIKGVSGNLGISKLYRLGSTLETGMKAGVFDVSSVETESFLQELENVVTQLS